MVIYKHNKYIKDAFLLKISKDNKLSKPSKMLKYMNIKPEIVEARSVVSSSSPLDL
jgi:hypothetical protein